jgi:hypothetical protein
VSWLPGVAPPFLAHLLTLQFCPTHQTSALDFIHLFPVYKHADEMAVARLEPLTKLSISGTLGVLECGTAAIVEGLEKQARERRQLW